VLVRQASGLNSPLHQACLILPQYTTSAARKSFTFENVNHLIQKRLSNTDIPREEQPYLRLIQDLNERVQVERPQSTPFRQQVSVTADIKLCIIDSEPDVYSDTCASGVKGVEERKRSPVVVM
jgi:hypothetical protein